MKTILKETKNEIIINKSRFISICFHCEAEEEFKEKLKQIKITYKDATHYCYAYSINSKQKSNDDGEPASTAGKPIKEMIINHELDNVAIVVVRYFGGIKLGAGPLTRAYASSANEIIKTSEIVTLEETQKYNLIYNYDLHNVVLKFLTNNKIKVLSTSFDINISCIIATNNSIDELINITNNKIKIEVLDKIILNI